MRAGINVWTWGIESKAQFEQGVKEAADIGYAAVESISSVAALYEDAPDEFGGVLKRYAVDFVCAYHHFSGDFERDYANAERYLAFFRRFGMQVMNLQAGLRVKGGPSAEDLKGVAERSTQIGELGKRHGVRVCLHPHFNTNVEQQHELDYLMGHVDPAVLGLTIDTAHAVKGGMDPVAVARQYGDRVGYVHMKDILPVTDSSVPWWSGFRELGRGLVDLPGFTAELRRAGFDGVLCVELDNPRVCGYKSAAISRGYLKDELGV